MREKGRGTRAGALKRRKMALALKERKLRDSFETKRRRRYKKREKGRMNMDHSGATEKGEHLGEQGCGLPGLKKKKIPKMKSGGENRV